MVTNTVLFECVMAIMILNKEHISINLIKLRPRTGCMTCIKLVHDKWINIIKLIVNVTQLCSVYYCIPLHHSVLYIVNKISSRQSSQTTQQT